MSKNFKFSERLQQVHNESEKIISSHIQRLDRISNDIKALEEVLLRAGIPFEFSYHLKKEICAFDQTKKHYSLEWDKKRFIYREYEGLGSFGSQRDEKIPLIETKSQVRIYIESELPIFYAKLIENLQENPLQTFVSVYSPNYKEEVIELPF